MKIPKTADPMVIPVKHIYMFDQDIVTIEIFQIIENIFDALELVKMPSAKFTAQEIVDAMRFKACLQTVQNIINKFRELNILCKDTNAYMFNKKAVNDLCLDKIGINYYDDISCLPECKMEDGDYVKNRKDKLESINRKIEMINEKYNDVARAKGYPINQTITPKRKNMLLRLLKAYPEQDDWKKLIKELAESCYLSKQKWFCFDYVFRNETTFDKVKNGCFRNAIGGELETKIQDEPEADLNQYGINETELYGRKY
jgi:hypothetical protein